MKLLQDSLQALISIFKRRPRGTFVAVFVSYVSVVVATTIGQEASYVKLEARQSAVEKGDQFTIDVYARAHVPVNAVDITLRFNADSAEVVSVDRGESVLTIWTEDPVITNNSVTLRGGTFRRGFLGEHKIATIDLRAKKVGQSAFKLENVLLLAGDGSGTEILCYYQ